MNKTGIGIDYSNICKDYNTAYLDRDNKDPKTAKCMKQVLAWTKTFLEELIDHFGFQLTPLNASDPVKIDDVASNRFLFYSLEKAITVQSFVLQKECTAYDNIAAWGLQSHESILIMNDEDGEGIYFYFDKDSDIHRRISEQLGTFSVDEVPFPGI